MDDDSCNWYRFAILLVDIGGEVLQELFSVYFQTSSIMKYLTFWHGRVWNPGNINYLSIMLSSFQSQVRHMDASNKTFFETMINGWKRNHFAKTVSQQVVELKKWDSEINDKLLSGPSNAHGTLLAWSKDVQREVSQLQSIFHTLHKWNNDFQRSINEIQLILLDLIKKHQNNLLMSLKQSFVDIKKPHFQDLQSLVSILKNKIQEASQAWQQDSTNLLSLWEHKLQGILNAWQETQAQNTTSQPILQDLVKDFLNELAHLHGTCQHQLQSLFGSSLQDLQILITTWSQELENSRGSPDYSYQKVLNIWQQNLNNHPTFEMQRLKDFLCSVKIHLQTLKDKKTLTEPQLSVLFPTHGFPNLQQFDISLLTALLRNACSVCPPELGWHVDDHLENDICTGTDILRLITCRNKFVAHIHPAKLPEFVFNDLWGKAKGFLLRLASSCGTDFWTEIRQKINTLNTGPIDPQQEKYYQFQLSMWYKSDLVAEMSEISFRSQATEEKLTDFTDMQELALDMVQQDLTAMHQYLQDLKEKISNLEVKISHLEEGMAIVIQKTSHEVECISELESIVMMSKRFDFESMRKEMQLAGLSTVNIQHLQKNLLLCYKFLNVIPISPLHESCNALLDDIFINVIIEKTNKENVRNLHEKGQPRNSKETIYLRSYHQIFGDKGNKRLILKGFMGSGKTVFCRKVVQTWCSIKTAQVDPESSGERQTASTSALDGEDILSQFEFLFFIDLAKVSSQDDLLHAIHRQCSIPNDIENKRFLCELLQIMPDKIVIILDGLDEMGSQTPDFVNDLLERKLYPQITILVSTRPWQISKLCLQAHSHYDLLLDLQGFDEERALDFATKVICAHDKDASNHLIKNMVESLKRKEIFATFRSVPLLLLFLVNVWCSDKSLPDQYSVLYSKIIDCMIMHCLNKTKGKHRNHKWVEMSDSKTKIMESSVFVKTFGISFLNLTSKLSYKFLLQRQHGTSAIISREKLLKIFDKDEETAESKLCVLLDCGILSKSDAFSPLERNYSVSFLHLTIQEFLAAIHLTLNEVVFREFISSWTCLDDVLQYENLVIFMCGLATNLGTLLFRRICEVCDHDSKVLEYRCDSVQCEHSHAIETLCSLYRICLNEVRVSASVPLSDIRINRWLTEKQLEDFLYMIMTFGVISAIKSFCLFCLSLSADTSECLCKMISDCTHLQRLTLWDLALHGGILDLSRLTGLTDLRLCNVTMSSECNKSLCRSISNCTHLQKLHLECITLYGSILDLSRLTRLNDLKLWNVTCMSSECSKSLCRSISNCIHLQKLDLECITLHDCICDLSRLTRLNDLKLWEVTMSSECSKSLCRSISNCTHLQKLDLEQIILHDSILDLSRLTGLTSFRLDNVIMLSGCRESLCRSISNCIHLKTLHLERVILHDSILDLSRLTGLITLELSAVIMSGECSESIFRSISNFTHLQALHLCDITLNDSILDMSRLTDLLDLNILTGLTKCKMYTQ